MAQLVKNPPAMWETWVRSLGWEDPLEKGKATRPLILLFYCLFNLYAEYIMRNTGLHEAQAGINIARRNIRNLRYADDTTLMAESEKN